MAVARAAIRACDPRTLVARALADASIAEPFSKRPHRLACLAFGKAAIAMANAAADRFTICAGLVVAPAAGEVPSSFELIVGGHPIPSAGSERAGRRALELAESLGAEDALLVLVSGGASALMAVPAEGVSLDDKREATSTLLRAGADIHALNTVRKHLSAIKGGWLAARTRAACRALVISDVVGDDLSVIASGPTVADASTFQDALDVLARHGGAGAYPSAVVARLRAGASGACDETPKPGDPRLSRARTLVVGSRRDAMEGAAQEASARGYEVVRIEEPIVGEARTAAEAYARVAAARAANVRRPTCVISTGETTVTVSGRGRGGRNQEFVLAWVRYASDADRTSTGSDPDAPRTSTGSDPDVRRTSAGSDRDVQLSIGTDGVDGPTDAAGAIADSTTLHRAGAAGLDPAVFLADNNAYAFFDALGDLIRTGPTGTNVGDLQLFLIG